MVALLAFSLTGCENSSTMLQGPEGEQGEQGEPGEKGEPGAPCYDVGSHIVLVQDELDVGENKEVIAICDDGFIMGGGCIFSGDLDRNAPHLVQYVKDEKFESIADGWLCAGTNMGPGAEQKYMGTFAVCSGKGPTIAEWVPEDSET